MADAKAELVRGWLAKAHGDLAAARKLGAPPDPALDAALYHCQQAAEKAVKGWLVWRDQPIAKTHDVRLLVELAMTMEPGFSAWREAAEQLTPYAVVYRYPGEDPDPGSEEFEKGLAQAKALVAFVLSQFPDSCQPA